MTIIDQTFKEQRENLINAIRQYTKKELDTYYKDLKQEWQLEGQAKAVYHYEGHMIIFYIEPHHKGQKVITRAFVIENILNYDINYCFERWLNFSSPLDPLYENGKFIYEQQ